MPVLPDFKLETFFSKWEFNAKYHMCASDMESMTLQDLLNLGTEQDKEDWNQLNFKYIETCGSPKLRSAVANSYSKLSSENILAFAGAEEGLYVAMHCILKKDDHAIIITPNYQSSETIPASICDVSGIGLEAGNNWNLDVQKIKDAIRPNTRLISINFPHNPTGKVISKQTLNDLIDIARQRGIYLFSDEVYRLMERSNNIRLPQVADLYEKGLSLNVMSKSYGLPGLRIGWIASQDLNLLHQMEKMKHYLSICNSSPSEFLAVIALQASADILSRNHKIIDDNLKLLNPFFAQNRDLFEWNEPDGGCIGYPKYLGSEGVMAFCERLIKEHGIMLLPGSIYDSANGPSPSNHFRIGYGRKAVKEGLRKFQEVLAS
ncbi:MAG: aminotransferase class I/II-fold pyridoxal phosphate-dependent enzyme [Woeseiaceae bacterium]|nr:aminotransferase class I/II-fold pyridoxal phosphate-dependent enzyme [Woeseiaceae bacterium]|tara:strand:- start:5904 stop:7031 length:1128 start_codon:yes stop_codon:yes gene_type:complete